MNDQRISESDLIIREDGSAYHIGLKTHQVPDKIIAVGDPGRVEMVSRHFDKIELKINKREFVSHLGMFQGKRILAISTGIGTDNVEIVLTELDALVNVDLKTRLPKGNKTVLSVIRVGTSGAMQADIPVGTELASVHGIGLDNLMNFYKSTPNVFEQHLSSEVRSAAGLAFNPYVAKGSQRLLKQVAFDMIEGNTVTCPGFYAPQGRRIRNEITYPNLIDDLSGFRTENFRLTNFEMETATYYALGNLLGHEMLSVNAIVVNRIKNEIADNSDEIVDRLIKKVLERI